MTNQFSIINLFPWLTWHVQKTITESCQANCTTILTVNHHTTSSSDTLGMTSRWFLRVWLGTETRSPIFDFYITVHKYFIFKTIRQHGLVWRKVITLPNFCEKPIYIYIVVETFHYLIHSTLKSILESKWHKIFLCFTK